jgi:hypothetical protein
MLVRGALLIRKVDLMLSMAACFPTYGAAAVRERGKELWEGIKTEVSPMQTDGRRKLISDPVQL